MIPVPSCFKRKCKFFSGVFQSDGTEMTEKVVCLAFPTGIPNEIAYGNNPHLEPFPGQENVIVFEEA